MALPQMVMLLMYSESLSNKRSILLDVKGDKSTRSVYLADSIWSEVEDFSKRHKISKSNTVALLLSQSLEKFKTDNGTDFSSVGKGADQ